MAFKCNSCKKSPPAVALKKCAKCSTTPYCSRDCQKADWKAHKKDCGKQADTATSSHDGSAAANLSPPKGLEQGVARPFTRLENRTWLHDRSERDVYYGLLIDAYRLRLDDTYNFEGEADADSIYGGATDGLRGFKCFLECVEQYGDSLFPMQLRMFAESVYGRAPGESDGTSMRQMMVAMEQGKVEGMASHLDVAAMLGRRLRDRLGGSTASQIE